MRYANRSTPVFWVLVFTLLLVWPALACAEDVCLSEESAKRLVVDLEKAKIVEEQLQGLQDYSRELEKQILLLKVVVTIQAEQIKKNGEAIEQYKQLMDYQDRACVERVKNAKTPWWETMTKIIGAFGAGALLGILLL